MVIVVTDRAEQQLWDILGEFSIPGTPKDVVRIFRGNIHDSYVSSWHENDRRYLHQWVNQTVFPDVDGLMSNIGLVTRHIQGRLAAGAGQADEKTLTLIPSKSGAPGVLDSLGGYWRTYEFIEKTRSFDVCEGPGHAREGARMFGRFVLHLVDLDPLLLNETIPYFQHSPTRFQQLLQAVERDSVGRCAQVRKELEFADRQEPTTRLIVEAVASGRLPERVIHYDTKLNNILFDEKQDRGICVVDLDTVMPGPILYDFGDLVRNAAVPAAEDETDLSKVEVDLDLFEALVQGYLEGTEGLLNTDELRMLILAPRVLALTLGMRFLTDYINGDLYFNIRRPEHNLERARTQFKIVQSMEEFEHEMQSLVKKHSG